MLNLPHLPGSADPQPRRCTSRFHITAGLLDTSLLTETRAMSSRVPENGGLGNASGRTPLSRVSITEPEPGVPPKNRERTRTALSIVANHAPSLAMRRAARWLKGLTRDQSAELTSIVSWILMVHYLSVFTLSYKSADFIEYARWLFGAATTQAAAAQVFSSHGQPCTRVHWSTSRLPAAAAAAQVLSSHGQPFSRAHLSSATDLTNVGTPKISSFVSVTTVVYV